MNEILEILISLSFLNSLIYIILALAIIFTVLLTITLINKVIQDKRNSDRIKFLMKDFKDAKSTDSYIIDED